MTMWNALKKNTILVGIATLFSIEVCVFSYIIFDYSDINIFSTHIVYADDDGGEGAGDGGGSSGDGGDGGGDDGGAGAGDGGNTNPADEENPSVGESSGSEGGDVAAAASPSDPSTPPSGGGGGSTPPSGGGGGGGGGAPAPSGGGGSSPCCGGGSYPPNVVLFQGPAEQPLAFVTLSQIPYTGYEAGPLGVALFWTLLVLWSVFVAYLLSVKQLHLRVYAALSRFSAPSSSASVHEHTHAIPKATSFSAEQFNPPVRPQVSEEHFVRTPVALANVSDYVSAVPLFIGWIIEGKSEQAFNFLRTLRMTEKSAQDFMEKTVCELDGAYRCRLDKTGGANEHTLSLISKLSNKQIEELIDALASGVDRSYGSEYTSAKVALVRALNASGHKAPAREEERAEAPATPSHEPMPVSRPIVRPQHDSVDDFVMAQINKRRT